MSPVRQIDVCAVTGFPRVSGDEPVQIRATALMTEFSPRERG